MLQKTLMAFAASVVLGCAPVATNALAAAGHGGGGHSGHGGGGHAMAGHARGGHVGGLYGGGHHGGGYRSGPVYGNCRDYGWSYNNGGCSDDGIVGGVINGVLGSYPNY